MSYITEITAVALFGDGWEANQPGPGWEVVRNQAGDAQDFNQGSRRKYIYIFYRAAETGAPVSGLRMIVGAAPTVPEGWTLLPVDFNDGGGGETIHLAYITAPQGPRIADLKAGFGDTESEAFDAFDPGDIVLRQNTNQGAKGKFIHLGFTYC